MQQNPSIPLSRLHSGEICEIVELMDSPYLQQLMEMGILPGTHIRVNIIAPLGDPIAIQVNGTLLSLRKDIAKYILVHKNIEVAKV